MIVQPTLQASVKVLRIIFISLMTGCIMFFLVMMLQFDFQLPPFKPGFDILNIVSIFLLISIPIGGFVSNKKLEAIQPGLPATLKIAELQTALIIRWATIEAPALLSLVVFMVLEDSKQIIVFLVTILAFVLANPTKDRIAEWGRFSPGERAEM
mgnify:CR=1 FL=1